MSKPSYESEIRNYYTEIELDPEQVNRLMEAVPFAAAAKRWKRIALAASMGLAAMLLLMVGVLFSRSTPESQHSRQVVNDKLDLERSLVVPDMTEPSSEQFVQPANPLATLPVEYRLVAFRSHNNQCPHCRATGQVFQNLVDSLDEPTIEMKEFDLSDPAAHTETQQQIREWKLNPLIDGRSETAFIALTDTNGRAIQEFKPSQGTKEIVTQVRSLLNH